MSTFVSVLIAFVVLMVFVFVHELGHYGAGRLFKFTILDFSLGMGPVLFKFRRNGIDYALRAFPIGGMCRFYGEDEDLPEGAGKGKPFNLEKAWKRFIVLLSGPLMNLIFAVLFAVIALLAYGDYYPAIESYSAENTPAQSAGLLPGDVIVGVEGRKILYYAQMSEFLAKADSLETTVTVLRDGKQLELTVKNIYNEAEGRNMLGIMIEPARLKFGLFEAIGHSFAYVWAMLVEMLRFIMGLFSARMPEGGVAGPVAVVSIISQAVRVGLEPVLQLAVLISVNLAFFNLLPIPALDGGRLVFTAIEMVRGKPVPPQREGVVHFVGFVLLMGLMVFLVVRDILGLVG